MLSTNFSISSYSNFVSVLLTMFSILLFIKELINSLNEFELSIESVSFLSNPND